MEVSRPTIKINKLEIGYKTKDNCRVVIKNINESLYSGELTCLLGANGVGKSTLLKTLSKFISKLNGDILILDKEIENYKVNKLARKISIVLTQRPQVYNMTVRELVESGRTPYTNFLGHLKANDTAIVNQALKDIGIETLQNRFINTLSDGEKQKALIAKALSQDTPIIFLDEPTAFLDYPSKVEVLKLLHSLAHTKGKTILLSTHDMELAYQIADKVWLFNKDKELITGAPEDLALNGTLNNFFNGSELFFEQHSGLFKVKIKHKGNINIEVPSKIKAHFLRALERMGFSNSPNSDIKIKVTEENPLKIEVITPNDNHTVHSITELSRLAIFNH